MPIRRAKVGHQTAFALGVLRSKCPLLSSFLEILMNVETIQLESRSNTAVMNLQLVTTQKVHLLATVTKASLAMDICAQVCCVLLLLPYLL